MSSFQKTFWGSMSWVWVWRSRAGSWETSIFDTCFSMAANDMVERGTESGPTSGKDVILVDVPSPRSGASPTTLALHFDHGG